MPFRRAEHGGGPSQRAVCVAVVYGNAKERAATPQRVDVDQLPDDDECDYEEERDARQRAAAFATEGGGGSPVFFAREGDASRGRAAIC
jgi:hypothetical protein